MGISGLLPLLKSIHRPCDLKKFAGQTIGVDAYGWLHRGTVACAIDLALGKPTTKYVDFAMSRVRMLIHFGITPYIVFDGDYLPSKAGTEKDRAARRKESKRVGLELLKLGKTSQAHLELQKAVDVTPEMARLFIEELKHHNIQYVVAPYEADSQLVYLERKGLINGILSEDSDLLVFGAKCLITKLDQYGACIEINRNLFTACREISLVGWTDADFRRMAILSGCDYLSSISKMGLKTAYRLLRKHKTVERVIKAAQFDSQFKVPQGYLESFTQAEMTFLYQWVFCPLLKKNVHCTEPEPGVDPTKLPYIGKYVSPEVAFGVARGDLNPHTKEPITVPAKDRSHSKPLRQPTNNAPPSQTPDMKHKPIDTFFKPKRTPLAELDPNCFTPSPSQRALLEQNSRPWSAAMAPPTRRSHPSEHISRTAPPPTRRTVSYPSTAGISDPSPSKRRRLCADSSVSTPDDGFAKVESGRSRFFASIPDPSPSVRPVKTKKKQDAEFNLWSDDSIEEAMAELPDLDDAPIQSKKKMLVFQDNSRSSIQSDSQASVFSRSSSGVSQESAGALTPATSCGSSAPEFEEGSLFGASGVELREKFSFSHPKKGSAPALTTVRSPTRRMKSLARTSSAPASSKVLQSLRTSSQSAAFLSKLSFAQSQANVKTTTGSEPSELEDSAWSSMEAEVVIPASSPASDGQEVVTSSPVKRKLQVQGSEDLLVPDSEDESDGSGGVNVALNLGRFAFMGN
ncbi:exonuclease-like protein [Delitschia confertaspora ATCC 74209]|uniref:Exonuclease-like protein n=1 Tax=Delitschia confertaspora ATCC 74209 TaxID=1513339 RepID=A0A9P4JI74_9PLEO|nr:exonuclease-like protein [Delitschia confertaspora ATCC 74209]